MAKERSKIRKEAEKMIPISQIDSELSIYKENTVVIWGAGLYGKKIFELLSSFHVKVSAFCDTNENKWVIINVRDISL